MPRSHTALGALLALLCVGELIDGYYSLRTMETPRKLGLEEVGACSLSVRKEPQSHPTQLPCCAEAGALPVFDMLSRAQSPTPQSHGHRLLLQQAPTP